MGRDEGDEWWHERQDDGEYVPFPESGAFPQPLLDLGFVIYSGEALSRCSIDELQILIGRHERGEWGDSPDDWIEANRKALQAGRLVRSYFRLDREREICIETDAVCRRGCCRRRHLTHVFVPYEVEAVCDLLGDRLLIRF